MLIKFSKGTSEFRSCVKVEVDVVGSPSLIYIVLVVFVDVKLRLKNKNWRLCIEPPPWNAFCRTVRPTTM